MRHMRRPAALLVLLTALLLGTAMRADAQPYPNRIIKLVVPFPAGGGADVLARLVTRHMTDDLGQPFLIQNQPGAGGALAFAEVARAAADGHTLIWTSAGFAVMAATVPNLAFRPAGDFVHIVQIAQNPFVLVVNPQVPAATVGELLALARTRPINFAHNGTGTLTSLAIDLLRLKTGVAVGQVGYRGDNFSISDVVAGHVQAMFSNSPVALPHIAEKRLRGLAVTGPRRSPAAPDLPTMIEAGVPDFEAVVWQGLSAPAGTPVPIVERLNAAVRRVLALPEVTGHFRDFGAERVGGTPAEFDALVARQLVAWADVVVRSGQGRP